MEEKIRASANSDQHGGQGRFLPQFSSPKMSRSISSSIFFSQNVNVLGISYSLENNSSSGEGVTSFKNQELAIMHNLCTS